MCSDNNLPTEADLCSRLLKNYFKLDYPKRFNHDDLH